MIFQDSKTTFLATHNNTQKQMQTAKNFLGILLIWKHILKAGFHWWQSGSCNSLWTGSLFGEKKHKEREGSLLKQKACSQAGVMRVFMT